MNYKNMDLVKHSKGYFSMLERSSFDLFTHFDIICQLSMSYGFMFIWTSQHHTYNGDQYHTIYAEHES